MKHLCKRCKKESERIYVKEYPGYYVKLFVDEKGHAWSSPNICSDCAKFRINNVYSRKQGHKPRKEVKESKNKKGYDSELIVKRYFETLGYFVKQSDMFGPDLTIENEFQTFTIEVKSAIMTSKKACYIPSVYPKRLNDDIIAIVFPNNFVYIETMSEHLKQCRPTGGRSVSRIYEDSLSLS